MGQKFDARITRNVIIYSTLIFTISITMEKILRLVFIVLSFLYYYFWAYVA